MGIERGYVWYAVVILSVCICCLLFKDFIVFMLSSIRAGGYFCFKRKDFNSSSLTSKVFSCDIIIFSLRAKLYGMLFLVCFGWHDVWSKYCLESVGL